MDIYSHYIQAAGALIQKRAGITPHRRDIICPSPYCELASALPMRLDIDAAELAKKLSSGGSGRPFRVTHNNRYICFELEGSEYGAIASAIIDGLPQAERVISDAQYAYALDRALMFRSGETEGLLCCREAQLLLWQAIRLAGLSGRQLNNALNETALSLIAFEKSFPSPSERMAFLHTAGIFYECCARLLCFGAKRLENGIADIS